MRNSSVVIGTRTAPFSTNLRSSARQEKQPEPNSPERNSSMRWVREHVKGTPTTLIDSLDLSELKWLLLNC